MASPATLSSRVKVSMDTSAGAVRGRFADLGRGPGLVVSPPLVSSLLLCGDPDGFVAAWVSGSGGAVLRGEALGVPLPGAASEGLVPLVASPVNVDLRLLRPVPVLLVDDVIEEVWSRDEVAGGGVGAGSSGGRCEPVPLDGRDVCRPGGSPCEPCCSAARHTLLCLT